MNETKEPNSLDPVGCGCWIILLAVMVAVFIVFCRIGWWIVQLAWTFPCLPT
jgi:hypothetical protein